MNDSDNLNLYLSSFNGIGLKTVFNLRQRYDDKGILGHFSKTYTEISYDNFLIWVEKIYKSFEMKRIKVLKMDDENYPIPLSKIYNAPYYLFYQGNLDLLSTHIFAVVGSRHPTSYGASITKRFAEQLANQGFSIISGLALGVDSLAHKSSINSGTIAVLGSGFDNLYPVFNTDLYREILEKNGLILTEYLPDVVAHRAYFPQRSRIIAGLAEGLLVTEAAEKSGSLIASKLAFEFGRNVYAIPGDINRSNSLGCNYLIKNNIAKLTMIIEDILEDFGVSVQIKPQDLKSLSLNSQNILNSLKEGLNNVNDIAASLRLSVSSALSEITQLELMGLIERMDSEIYLKI